MGRYLKDHKGNILQALLGFALVIGALSIMGYILGGLEGIVLLFSKLAQVLGGGCLIAMIVVGIFMIADALGMI